jgi:purine-binding chemotaxis protein CheW
MSDQEQAANEVTVDSPSPIDVVLLRTGDAVAALPATSVEYVAELTKLTPLPHTPAVVAGLTALRGEVVVVFFLRPFLGLELPAVPEHARIVVVAREDERFVLAVDEVIGPVALAFDERGVAKTEGAVVRGVDPSGVALLDPDALLADERLFVDIPLPQAEHAMAERATR